MSDETGSEAPLDDVVADGRPLRSFLDDEETVAAVLRGTMLDAVHGAGEDSDRARTMTPEPGGIAALATDRRLLFVVDRRERVDVTEVPVSNVAEAVVETMGEAVRLTLRTEDGPSYTFYPDEGDEAAARAAAEALEGDESAVDSDPMDRLERLADLHERGALSDEEFESKKRDLLDRI